jgi:hypothetical protein
MAAQTIINWEPPTTFYIYNGELYCKPCGNELVEKFNDALDKDVHGHLKPLAPWDYEDSNSWPQEYPQRSGETDSPDHCGVMDCQRFLGRTLTEDGVEYVKRLAGEDLDQHGAIGDVVQGWLDYYGITLDQTDGEDMTTIIDCVACDCDHAGRGEDGYSLNGICCSRCCSCANCDGERNLNQDQDALDTILSYPICEDCTHRHLPAENCLVCDCRE